MLRNSIPGLLLVGGAPYFAPATSQHKHLARAWRKAGGRVLYLEIGGEAEPINKRLSSGQTVAQAEDGIFVMRLEAAFGLPWSFPEILRKFNLRSFLPRVKQALNELRFERGKFVALYYGWFWDGWLGELGAQADVYDCIDEHRASVPVSGKPRLQRHVWDAECRMLKKTDLLLVTSEVLLEARAALVKNSHVLPHAVDIESFKPCVSGLLEEPSELAALKRPRLVLSGNLQPKLDFRVLEQLAAGRPDWNLLMIGRREKGTELPGERANLKWLGPKPFQELPAYLAHVDVGLVPLLDTPYNRASSPLKVLEYLAAGLPVVTSVNPVTLEWQRAHPETVWLVAPGGDWMAACEQALAAGRLRSRNEIHEAVKHRTYEDRVGKIWALVRNP